MRRENDEGRISTAGLPTGWTMCRLGDALSLVNGRAYSQHEMLNEGTPILRIQNLNKGKNWYYSNLNLPPDKYCNEGDLLFAWSATFGPYWWQGPKAIFHYHIWNVFPSELMSKEFAFYELMRVTDDLKRSAHGVAMPHITKGGMEEWEIMLPPPSEQKRIADKLEALLGRVDACRARLARVPALLKRFRQSVLAAATSGKLTEEWRMTNGVNDEWEETQIQHVANVGTGSTPLRSNSAFFAPKGTPWVTSAATSQKLVTESEEFVTDAAIKAHRLKKYPVGTLLVAMYGEGKTRGQVTELGIEATINQACAAIYVDESIITKRFVKFSLEANYLEMRELAEGGNQPNLNLSKIKEFPIGLPTLPEQQEIVRRVEDLFAFADRIEARLATAQKTVERLTPATLAKAFRGELVPQDPNDEPASKLLNRIRERTSVMPQSLKRKSSISNGKNNKPTKMKSNESKSIMATLYNSDEPLSASELFALCGYPGDSDTKCVESFFVEIRAALDSRLITKERIGDEDFFQITQS